MSDESIEKGIAKAKKYNLDVKNLEKAIEKLQDRTTWWVIKIFNLNYFKFNNIYSWILR